MVERGFGRVRRGPRSERTSRARRARPGLTSYTSLRIRLVAPGLSEATRQAAPSDTPSSQQEAIDSRPFALHLSPFSSALQLSYSSSSISDLLQLPHSEFQLTPGTVARPGAVQDARRPAGAGMTHLELVARRGGQAAARGKCRRCKLRTGRYWSVLHGAAARNGATRRTPSHVQLADPSPSAPAVPNSATRLSSRHHQHVTERQHPHRVAQISSRHLLPSPPSPHLHRRQSCHPTRSRRTLHAKALPHRRRYRRRAESIGRG